MKKIAITGTHGVGKTTLAHQICVALKENNFNSTIVEEKARSCPFPINEKATTDTEIWMVHTQIRAELDAKACRFEVAVIDRCSLDAKFAEAHCVPLHLVEVAMANPQWACLTTTRQ